MSRSWKWLLGSVAALGVGTTAFAGPPDAGGPMTFKVTTRLFELLKSESGPVNYYTFVDGPPEDGCYIHAAYRMPYHTAVMTYPIPEEHRDKVVKVRWRWRAVVLPRGGDECAAGKEDSAAVVYLTFKRRLKWYSLKYVWSAGGQKGAICDKRRNPFRAQDTTILESGEPLRQWRTVELDPRLEFRNHFEGGDPKADVPDFVGFGIMTDGDQTESTSEADYGGFSYDVR